MPFSLSATDIVSIIDDDPFVRAATGNLVHSLGGEAREFASGPAFLASDIESRTGCLICDIQMAKMDGIEVLSRIEARGLYIPTLLITAFATSRVRARVQGRAAPSLLEKPIDVLELESWLERALGCSGRQ